MSFTKQLSTVLPLSLILLGLFAYNFMSAQWMSPGQNPPNNNVVPPINVGTSTESTQSGFGDLAFHRLVAFSEVRSDWYCDSVGLNCILQSDINRFNAFTYIRTKTQSGVLNGQKVSMSCDEDGDGVNSFDMMTGGGCRVIGTYDELATDEGDIFSYPIPNWITATSSTPSTWNCENRNLGSATIETSVVCATLLIGDPGGA